MVGRFAAAVLVAAAMLGLAGCAPAATDGGTPRIVVGPADAAGNSAGPDGTVVLTLAAAADTYQRLSTPGNDALDRWLQAGPVSVDSLVMHAELAGQAADAWQQFAAGLRAYTWPVAAEPHVLRLAGDLDVRAAQFWTLSRAGTVDQYDTAVADVALSSDAAVEVRVALGLEPAATFCACAVSPT